jgi:hypothetical protein
MSLRVQRFTIAVIVFLVSAALAEAQSGSPAPDQATVNLPTTQALRRHGSYFRLTHRFARDLRRGNFGQLASDLFGLDNGAIIGLDFRFAPFTNTQVAFYRSLLLRTIQLSGRYDGWKQSDGVPLSLSVAASIEGVDNMRDHHSPSIALVLSRSTGPLAVYLSPTAVFHSSTPALIVGDGHDHGVAAAPEAPAMADDERTFYAGIGGRLRLRPSVALVAEIAPRLGGFTPGRAAWGVAIEKSTRGGHAFQLNFTNTFGTTVGQTARGGDSHNVYLGFNLSRRF